MKLGTIQTRIMKKAKKGPVPLDTHREVMEARKLQDAGLGTFQNDGCRILDSKGMNHYSSGGIFTIGLIDK